MSENQEFEYAAVITITLRDGGAKTNIEVTLTSADPITGLDGTVKPLRDCTLADLQHFADKLEDEIWDEYKAVPLFDLVVQGRAELEMSDVINDAETDDEDEIASPELLLEKAVVFPPEQAPPSKEIVIDAAEQASEAEEVVREVEIDEEVVETPAEPVQEESPPEVSVDETESVHEEPEFDTTSEIALAAVDDARLKTRILGRRRPLNHATWTAVDILVNEHAFRDTQAHAVSVLGREVAGVLIGPHPEKQPDGRYIVQVSDTIIAKHTRMHGASVTYTPESWRYVNDRLAELYPEDSAVIVGWYHTHPGFGIFMSSMDRFIHQNFFTQIWHVAMVLDPLARRSGFFCWNREMSQVDEYEFPWPVWAPGSW